MTATEDSEPLWDRRELRLGLELCNCGGANVDAEKPRGMELVTLEYGDTGWEVGRRGDGGGETRSSNLFAHSKTPECGDECQRGQRDRVAGRGRVGGWALTRIPASMTQKHVRASSSHFGDDHGPRAGQPS